MALQDGANAEMHHLPHFPSSVKTPPLAKSSPTRSRELLLASSVDDIAAVLARGFEISPSSSGTARPNLDQHSQPSPPPPPSPSPSGGDNSSSVCMRTKAGNMSSSSSSGTCTNTASNNQHNNSDMCMNADNKNSNSGMPIVTSANKSHAYGTPSVTNKYYISRPPLPQQQQQQQQQQDQRVRGQGAAAAPAPAAAAAAVSGGRRSTRAQKKNAKKWLSKRQGRMPGGAPTIPGGTSS